jgi:dimethylglycine dehydrogenase
MSVLKPVKKSPLHHRLASADASLTEVSGWLLADQFVEPRQEADSVRAGAGLCDLSHAAKWQVHGAGLGDFLKAFLDSPAPEVGRSSICEGGLVARTSREQAFFVIYDAKAPLFAEPPAPAKPGECAHVADRTAGFGCFLLCGPRATPVLRKCTPLDLRDSVFPDLTCAWTPLAGVRCLLLRKDWPSVVGYIILVSREYAEYLWNALLASEQEFRIQPFGRKAASLLEIF